MSAATPHCCRPRAGLHPLPILGWLYPVGQLLAFALLQEHWLEPPAAAYSELGHWPA